MAGVSGGKLAAATCQAGALGFIAAGHLMELESLEQELAAFRQEAPTSPLCIGFIGYSTFGTDEGWESTGACASWQCAGRTRRCKR
jgi:hypothetical protein